MNWGKILFVLVIVVVMGAGLYSLNQKKNVWQAQVNELSQEMSTLQNDNKSLQANLDYLKDPQNLLKELKSQFNYRQAGENLIIIVPEGSSTVSSTLP